MKSCTWVEPQIVACIEFAEWTGADKLRHTKFIALRNDKDRRKAYLGTRKTVTLQKLSGYKRAADVKRWLRNKGIALTELVAPSELPQPISGTSPAEVIGSSSDPHSP